MVLGEPAGDAVVHHDAVLGAHDAVPDLAHRELGPLVDVELVQQPRYVWAPEVQLADRGDVDDPDVLPDRPDLGGRVAVVVGANPLSRDQGYGAIALVPGLHR